jgi:hypothetical protein
MSLSRSSDVFGQLSADLAEDGQLSPFAVLFLHLVLEIYFHVIGKYVRNEYGIFSLNVHKSSINWNRKNCFFFKGFNYVRTNNSR